MSLNYLDIGLENISYIDKRTLSWLRKANFNTIGDMLLSYPSHYSDYTCVSFDELRTDVSCSFKGTIVSSAKTSYIRSSLNVMYFDVNVDNHILKVSLFNRLFIFKQIQMGRPVIITGKIKENFKQFTASEIHFMDFASDYIPDYDVKGVTNNNMFLIKKQLFQDYGSYIEDDIPRDFLDHYGLISKKEALKALNVPESDEEVQNGLKRFKYEELLRYTLKLQYAIYQRKHTPDGINLHYKEDKVEQFIHALPYTLTPDQATSVQEILSDMASPYQMNRLLQGEVGSGKTVVAGIALYACYTAGYQGAIMAPTEVLAKQHYETFSQLFKGTGMIIGYLSSALTTAEKHRMYEDLDNGVINLVIGTQALFGRDVSFLNLGLVVTDEEHRFGVKQRAKIIEKGRHIDHLSMSATPIPRSLALTIAGSSDLSTIKTLPGNRKKVYTEYVNHSHIKVVYDRIDKELQKGKQIYIVTPMIEENTDLGCANAEKVYVKTAKYYEGQAKVGLIHSKLTAEQKERVMKEFSENKIQILVATTVIEVGVNVVNASTIVILDADRFGIAQLHQLRGRVRRGSSESYCFLVSDTTVDSSIKRLNVVASTTDGFELAEADLEQRGPGDFFGEEQSGLIDFKVANIIKDKDILNEINHYSQDVVNSHKLMDDKDYALLYRECIQSVRNNI